jgi:hypothetical protein
VPAPDLSTVIVTSSAARPIHARRVWTEPALCGDVGPSQYATSRRYVNCAGCVAEIERRLAKRKGATS